MAYGSPQSNKYLNNLIRTEHIIDSSITTAKVGVDAITDAKTEAHIPKTLKFFYDGVTKTTGARTLAAAGGGALQIPAGAILVSYMIESLEAFTSDGSATLALGYTGTAAGIMAATAFDNAAIAIATTGFEHSATIGGAIGGIGGAAKNCILTIAGAAITAGTCHVFVTYIEA